jgi:hypothetical protein
MMCAHLMCFDRFPELLNEYKHCGHLLFLTLLCTHLMRHYATPERGIMGFMPPARAAVTARGLEGA